MEYRTLKQRQRDLFVNPTLIVIVALMWAWAFGVIGLEAMLLATSLAVLEWWLFCRLFLRRRSPWRDI